MAAAWFLVLLPLAVALLISLKLLLPKHHPLPPGPSAVAFFIKNVVLQQKSLFELETIIHDLHSVYGPIFALRTLPAPTVFVQDRALAHQALVQRGAVFADRPPVKEPMIYLSCDRHDVSSSPYAPLWRRLRRNLASEMLHPSRVKQFGEARRWALGLLLDKIRDDNQEGVVFKEKIKSAVFSLMVALNFGEKLGEGEVKEIERVQYSLLLLFVRFNVFAVLPQITKILFRKRWNAILATRRRQMEMYVPLIRARRDRRKLGATPPFQYCYIDSLLDVRIPEEGGRELREDEMVNLCHEFMTGGTDTTSTALEWIMAELVKHQDVQKKLAKEIDDAVAADAEETIKEEDLERMPYLKAVIMEALRRHPPGHFVLPHRASEEAELGGYRIPKGSEVHLNIAQIGWDGGVWEEPMEFRPERFLKRHGGEYDGEMVDITGSREIKMMPFGAGRRICPGMGLATLHLEWFVANLVREFEWTAAEGEEVDLSEDFEFTVIMKKPLRARVLPRR